MAQMFPHYRAFPYVQAAAPCWCVACVFQAAWSLVFVQERITLSFVLMLGILVGLLPILWFGASIPGSNKEYWLLRAPFSLHAGWILVASAVNANVVADAAKASPDTLLAFAILAFAVVLLVVIVFTAATPIPDPIICFVAFWAFMGIYSELRTGKNLHDPTRFNPHAWDPVVTSCIQWTALVLSFASLTLGLVAVTRASKLPMQDAKNIAAEPVASLAQIVGV